MPKAIVFLLPLALLGATSCGLTKSASAGGKPGPTRAMQLAQFSLKDLRPSPLPIVEVREKDLKVLPLGDERALAYLSRASKERARREWASVGPVDFIEPDLPDVRADVEAGLLPPKPD
jgi:hypothetical protein